MCAHLSDFDVRDGYLGGTRAGAVVVYYLLETLFHISRSVTSTGSLISYFIAFACPSLGESTVLSRR